MGGRGEGGEREGRGRKGGEKRKRGGATYEVGNSCSSTTIKTDPGSTNVPLCWREL